MKIAYAPKFTGTNPYQNRLTEHLEKHGVSLKGIDYNQVFLPSAINKIEPDIVHLHWLHKYSNSGGFKRSLYNLVEFILGLIILKIKGIKLIWTIHNLENHEQTYPKLDSICRFFVILLADAVIVHSETAKREVLNKFRLNKFTDIFVIPHANYIGEYENIINNLDAKKALNIPEDSIIMLFFGLVRVYKGIPELLKAFKQLNNKKVYLVIAGESRDNNLSQLIRKEAKENNNIRPILKFIAEDKVQIYMNASDVVVCPYRKFLTSGVLVLAMSFGKACIAPSVGCVDELLDESGGWLYQKEDRDSLLKAMEQAVSKRSDLPLMGQHNIEIAEKWDWNCVAEETFKVYQKCLGI